MIAYSDNEVMLSTVSKIESVKHLNNYLWNGLNPKNYMTSVPELPSSTTSGKFCNCQKQLLLKLPRAIKICLPFKGRKSQISA